jgi:hypothetical protein
MSCIAGWENLESGQWIEGKFAFIRSWVWISRAFSCPAAFGRSGLFVAGSVVTPSDEKRERAEAALVVQSEGGSGYEAAGCLLNCANLLPFWPSLLNVECGVVPGFPRAHDA